MQLYYLKTLKNIMKQLKIDFTYIKTHFWLNLLNEIGSNSGPVF